MTPFAVRAMEDARARAAHWPVRAPAPVGDAGGSPISSTGSPRPSLASHAEQYRHNQNLVYATVRLIAQRVAHQPFHLARRAAKAAPKAINPVKGHLVPSPFKAIAAELDVLESHPLIDLMDRPNPIMVGWALKFVTVASLELTGKSHWWVKQDAATRRWTIWPLPSHWVEPVHTSTALYAGWYITPGGTGEKFLVPGNEIVLFSYPDPSHLLGSVSPLQAQARTVMADEAVVEAQRRQFLNGPWPGLAITVGRHPSVKGQPGERPFLTKEQRQQVINMVLNQYRGVSNIDHPMIFDALIEKAEPITNTPKEMAFLESGAYTKERVTLGFTVNPVSMGQVQGVNYASSAAADGHLLVNNVNPKIELISQTITAFVCPLFCDPIERLVGYLEEATSHDPDEIRQNYDLGLRSAACSRNEYRTRVLHLPPIWDGDTVIIPAGGIPVDIVREDQPPPPYREEGQADRGKDFTPMTLDVPDVRQGEDYSCGAACTLAVLRYFGVDDNETEANVITALSTSEQEGTAPRRIRNALLKAGLPTTARGGMNVGNLRRALDAGRLAVCPVQALGTEQEEDTFQSGHYRVVIGYDRAGLFYHDPVTGRGYATDSEWAARWEDRGSGGEPFRRYAIISGAPEPEIDDPPLFPKATVGFKAAANVLRRAQRRHEVEVQEATARFLNGQRRRVLARLKAALKSHPPAPLDSDPPDGVAEHEWEVKGDEDVGAEALMDRLYPEVETAKLVGALTPKLAAAALDAAEREYGLSMPSDKAVRPTRKVDRKPMPAAYRDEVNARLDELVAEAFWGDVTKTARLRVARAVRRGMARRESAEEIAARVEEVLSPLANDLRAKTIARTEATTAVNVGADAVRDRMKEMGYRIRKVWTCKVDGRERDTHHAAHGQSRVHGKPFKVGGFACDYPGDPSLPAKERVNCRCLAVTTVVSVPRG